MKLIIDIDEEIYNEIKSIVRKPESSYPLDVAIRNGTPIKDGDLISREALKKELDELFESGGYDSGLVMNTIDNAPTVEQKHTLNDSIRNIQLVCKSNNVCCVDCPMNYNCKEEPARWEVIKNETDN